MRFVTLPNGVMLLLTGLLAACGSGSAIGADGPARVATNTPAAASAAPGTPPAVESAGPSPTAVPSAVSTVAPPPDSVAPAEVAPAEPKMAQATSQAFPLVAVGDPGARGSVTVTTQSGRAAISIVAGGLPPGSLHSVHLHFGNCPSAGSHIQVLGTLRADASGSGSVTANLNAVFTGPGHFVIVYIGPAAGPLGACANLG